MRLTLGSLVDSCTMCISPIVTRVLCILFTVKIIGVSLQRFTESVSLRETSSPNCSYFNAVKVAQLGSALM